MVEKGHETGASVQAWHNIWATNQKADQHLGLHTFRLSPSINVSADSPEGSGFGSFSPKASGAVSIQGQLPDGSPFLTTTFLGPQGQILIYQPLYGNKGSFRGVLSMDGDAANEPASQVIISGVAGTPTWLKPAQPENSKDTLYNDGKDGFFTELDVAGDLYVRPLRVKVLMRPGYNSVCSELEFINGGLVVHTGRISLPFYIVNPSNGLTNQADMPTPAYVNQYQVTMPLMNNATGAFGGTFYAPAAEPWNIRQVSYQGLMVYEDEKARGWGYFIHAESKEPRATRRSGHVKVRSQ